jgi:hypothetical protein
MSASDYSRTKRVPLTELPRRYGFSIVTWRRALRLPDDPLPHARVLVTGGDPKHARILVRLVDVEAWLRRRHAAATLPVDGIEENG